MESREAKKYIFPRATVRIHEGRLTEEQRRMVLEDAAKDFYRAIVARKQKEGRA